jgi:hypothetical protein
MTKQFHEGQDVEVLCLSLNPKYDKWRKAKIVSPRNGHTSQDYSGYVVQFPFPDGSRAVIDAEHIRTVGHVGVASGKPSAKIPH